MATDESLPYLSLCFATWVQLGNLLALFYMSAYSHVEGVPTFLNWLPTVLANISSLICIVGLAWSLKRIDARKYLPNVFRAAFTTYLISVSVVSVLNYNSESELEEVTKPIPGTKEDVAVMVKILASVSTSYNWLVTIGLFMFTLVHISYFDN